MSKQTDIRSILILGAGPIIIGQACEFDYAGTQACLSLKSSGYKVILVNPNPATIMTDPGFSDVTYIEPLTIESVTQIIAKERPDAILPTMGGQVALNLAVVLEKNGVLAKHNVRLIGANVETIERAEDRKRFHELMEKIGLGVPLSYTIKNVDDSFAVAQKIGFPIMVRPSFVLGGRATGIATNENELMSLCNKAFKAGPNYEVTLEESLLGWKEFEMEVVRDRKDNCIVVCTIENLDPIGIHTGDSITVAPAQTLTDKEYQKMRSASFDILRAVAVETGGANVQFAVNPTTGRMLVIEMNPRVSRSSALASKVTGFPIAKVAAKLAVGFTLDELKADILGSQIPASFEPVIDNVVVKIPFFQFEKFPEYQDVLNTQMQSVGESMAIGRTFSEALLKCMRSIELEPEDEFSSDYLSNPNSKRLWYIFTAFRNGMTVEKLNELTMIDPWFLREIYQAVLAEKNASFTPKSILSMKRIGFSDQHLGNLLGCSQEDIRTARNRWGIKPIFKRVDGCSAEFATNTVYSYSTYEQYCEANPTDTRKVIIIGSGSNRIGQGIEFDYSCVHVVKTLKALHYETIMINCNPETVSTDYDCADRLYCSPLTVEDILPIVEVEKPIGILLQFGGQLPLNLAAELDRHNVPLLGIDLSVINTCEDRAKFKKLSYELELNHPENWTISSKEELPKNLPYPLIVRPSYVLGGRAMVIVKNEEELLQHLLSLQGVMSEHPVLIEHFLENALEIEIDAISDGKEVFVPTIMEQIQPAGVHSGDSTCYIPPQKLSKELQDELMEKTRNIALRLGVKGFINVQFAVLDNTPYIIEVNPRCSRTVPFLSKSLGIDFVDIATRCIMGFLLPKDIHAKVVKTNYFFVKEPVFSSSRFNITTLGPEMKSTGEVMGIGTTFEEAYNKAKIAAGSLPNVLIPQPIKSLQEIFDSFETNVFEGIEAMDH